MVTVVVWIIVWVILWIIFLVIVIRSYGLSIFLFKLGIFFVTFEIDV